MTGSNWPAHVALSRGATLIASAWTPSAAADGKEV
jgi:hypothetical protein